MDKILSVIQHYVPEGTATAVTNLIYEYRIHLHIKRDRRSKAGDYRGPVEGDPRHRISINHNLNPYAFLITLIHELAHRRTWGDRTSTAKPHGKEWKQSFRSLMDPFLNERVFPPDLLPVLRAYLENPAASSGSDEDLARALRKYDLRNQAEVLLEELPEGSLFRLGDERIFKKGKLRRKRFLCECISDGKNYLVSGIATVTPDEGK